MAKRRVVLTGAAGRVAQRMFKALDERWDVVPIDIRPTTADGTPLPRTVVADLSQADRDAYRQHFRGADAVIHCGFVRAPGMTADTWQDNSDAKFQAEHANVAMAYNVYRVALGKACAGSSCAAPTTPPITTRGWCGTAAWTW